MIGYVTLGTNNPQASIAFYDAVLVPMGMVRKFAQDNGWTGYGLEDTPDADVEVCICPPFNGEAATAGNGTMIAFRALNKEQVDTAWQAGMNNGGLDEGQPGFRPADSTHFYGAYLRDPAGNKICLFSLQ